MAEILLRAALIDPATDNHWCIAALLEAAAELLDLRLACTLLEGPLSPCMSLSDLSRLVHLCERLKWHPALISSLVRLCCNGASCVPHRFQLDLLEAMTSLPSGASLFS